MKGYELLREEEIDRRVIMNTNHPVMLTLVKQGPRDWMVNIVCNGVGQYSKQFRIKRNAQEHFEKMLEYKREVAKSPGEWRLHPSGCIVRE